MIDDPITWTTWSILLIPVAGFCLTVAYVDWKNKMREQAKEKETEQ